MTRYVAFLRAINVGGHTVTMAELRSLVADAGFGDVSTFIASGNVLLSADAEPTDVEQALEKAFADALGYAVETFVRTRQELQRLAAAEPFGVVDGGHKVQVGFLKAVPSATVRAAVAGLSNDYDTLLVEGREVFWHTRGGISDSLVKPGVFNRALGQPSTFRNVTTVRRLADKLA